MAQVTLDEIESWNAGAREITEFIAEIPADRLDDVVVGEWSARQILTHMLDSELVFSVRLRTAIATPGHPVSAFDPDAMGSLIPYHAVALEHVSQAFLALRSSNTEILKALPESSWKLTIHHPEHGAQELAHIVRVFGPHIGEHLEELRAAHAQRA